MDFLKLLTREERKLYGRMSKEQQKEFKKNKEEQQQVLRRDKKQECGSGRELDAEDLEDLEELEELEELDEFDYLEQEPKAGSVRVDSEGYPRAVKIPADKYEMAGTVPLDQNKPVREQIKMNVIKPQNVPVETGRKEGKGKRRIRTNFVMDRTFSFSVIFPEVYRSLECLMKGMSEMKKEHPTLELQYGLTLFGDTIQNVEFGDGYFTSSEAEFLNAVKKVEFTGGSEDGYEMINEGIEAGIRVLEKYSEEDINKGIVVLTDSMPEDTSPKFMEVEGCPNNGLRFAIVYVNDDCYLPTFKIVDGDGDVAGSQKNQGTTVMCIEKLMRRKGAAEMKNLVTEIMYVTSVTQTRG